MRSVPPQASGIYDTIVMPWAMLVGQVAKAYGYLVLV
jgi:hypothetical protein